MEPKNKRVYIAGPYTQGDVAVNVANAIQAGAVLMNHGIRPFVPHLSHFAHMMFPRPYEDWIYQDLEWLRCCGALLRLPGESPGADVEVAHARKWEIPVYTSMDAMLAAYDITNL